MKYLILLMILPTMNLSALTDDLELEIASNSPLTIEYVLAKGVCKMLNRELDLSKFMGGNNKLDCNVSVTGDTKKNLELMKLNEIKYAILNTNHINDDNELSDFQAIIYLEGITENWLLITSKNSDSRTICEITEALFNNYLEFSYLHSNFKNFSPDTFSKKKYPFHMGSFKYFDKKNCKLVEDTLTEF